MNKSCFYNTIDIKLPAYRITLSTIYSCTAATTVTVNVFVFYAIWKTSSLHRPSFVLVANLALTDFLVGALGEPAMVITHVAALNDLTNLFCYSWIGGRVVSYWLCSMSLLTLTAMGVDRLLAVTLLDRYQEVVTVKRMVRILIASWGFLGLLMTLAIFPITNVVVFVAIFLFVLLFVLALSYIIAFHKLRKLPSKVKPNHDTNTENPRNPPFQISKYRRSLDTMLLVTVTIILFFAPLLCCAIATAIIYAVKPNHPKSLTYKLMTSGELIAVANSAVNPFVYTLRMRELREAVKHQVKRLFEK